MRTDEAIKKDVINAMYWDDRVDASRVTVEVDAGHVTLTGVVGSYRARDAAESDARMVGGVTGIDNLIVVTLPSGRTAPDDADILAEVRERLDRDPDVEAGNVMVSVDRGSVLLEGSVPSYWQKEIAEGIAGTAFGVVEVTDKLAVVPARDVEDELIAEDIVAALDRNAMLDVENIDVEVVDGLVSLRGAVPSWYARDLAVSTARYTKGVVDVEDHLIVGEPGGAS